jgi:hypothetical protein
LSASCDSSPPLLERSSIETIGVEQAEVNTLNAEHLDIPMATVTNKRGSYLCLTAVTNMWSAMHAEVLSGLPHTACHSLGCAPQLFN